MKILLDSDLADSSSSSNLTYGLLRSHTGRSSPGSIIQLFSGQSYPDLLSILGNLFLCSPESRFCGLLLRLTKFNH